MPPVSPQMCIRDSLRPIQEEFTRLIGDKAYLEQCYTKSAEIALRISQRTLDKAMKKVGLSLIHI